MSVRDKQAQGLSTAANPATWFRAGSSLRFDFSLICGKKSYQLSVVWVGVRVCFSYQHLTITNLTLNAILLFTQNKISLISL